MPGFWKKLIVFQYVFIQPGGLSWKPARMLCSRGLGCTQSFARTFLYNFREIIEEGHDPPGNFEKRGCVRPHFVRSEGSETETYVAIER